MTVSALLLSLIRRYVEVASRYAANLREEFRQNDLLYAVNSHRMPREGFLPSGARYTFHGVGCTIEDPAVNIDFDFGPEGRSDGFDAWRLCGFAQQLPEFASLHDLPSIERGLEQLRREGLVRQPRWEPSPHLFYLSEDDSARLGGRR